MDGGGEEEGSGWVGGWVGRTEVLAEEAGKTLGGGVSVVGSVPEDEDMKSIDL